MGKIKTLFIILASILWQTNVMALVCGPNGREGYFLKIQIQQSGEEFGYLEDHGVLDIRNKAGFLWCNKLHCERMGKQDNYDVGNLMVFSQHLGMEGFSKGYSLFLMALIGGGMAFELSGMLGTQLVMESGWFRALSTFLKLSPGQALYLSSWFTIEGWASTTAIYGYPMAKAKKLLLEKEKGARSMYWDFYSDLSESDKMSLVFKSGELGLDPEECGEESFKSEKKFFEGFSSFLAGVDYLMEHNEIPRRGAY